MKCDKCKGKGHLDNDGNAYTSWISVHHKATVIGCFKDLEKGIVSINFGIKDPQISITMDIPIEYYYMMTGKRKWNLSIDEDGNIIK